MIIINLCNRCGHEWAGRKLTKPVACPACRTKLWDIPRVYQRRDPSGLTRREIKLNESKRLYGFHDLEIGQSQIWTFEKGPEFNNRRAAALNAHCRRTGKLFIWDSDARSITRTK